MQTLNPVEKVAYLLKQTFLNPNDTERKNAETILIEMRQNPKKYIEHLILVIVSPESQSKAIHFVTYG